MSEKDKKELAEKLRTKLRPDPVNWARAVNNAFVSVFDRLYGWRTSNLNRILWRAILFSYAILFISRWILWALAIPVPPTESILATAVTTSVATSLLAQAFRSGSTLAARYSIGKPSLLPTAVRDHDLRSFLVCGCAGIAVGAVEIVLISNGLGFGPRTTCAIALGGVISLPLMLLLVLLPDSLLPVAPLRALASSLCVMVLLALVFPSAAKEFVHAFADGHWKVVTFVAFNLFADVISLVETRWVLLRSGRALLLRSIVALLIVDLILSALIYLVLPGIADQDFTVLRDGILFRGSMPWLGILFWSTFATSVLFYLFVLAVLVLKSLAPLLRFLERADRWFSIYNHPTTLVTVGMAVVLMGVYLGAVLLR